MKLFAIRHGQTDYNAERRFQGQANIPLNETGQAQVRRTGLVLGQLLNIDSNQKEKKLKVISSDLLRTQQSTEIICSELTKMHAHLQTDVSFDHRLREFHCGLLENCTYEEFTINNPDLATNYMAQFDHDAYATRYPGAGGESRLDVMHRVGQALLEIQSLHHTDELVWVVHGGVIDVLLELTHIQTNEIRTNRISAGNGDIIVLETTETSLKYSPRAAELGHAQAWRVQRHYRIGDTIAAKVVR